MDQMWGDSVARSDAADAARGQLFRDGNYAMFIHWGLFSHLGGVWKGKTYYGIGEWIMHSAMAGIPPGEYKDIAREFNPSGFDAHAIARLAKDAGMKYVVITSKHHEGFAMFHSRADAFNIVDASPFKRDPMKELAIACRELDLGFGFYYSHWQDWMAPGGSGGPTTHPDGTPASFEEYFRRKCLPQVAEITTNYGPLEIIWFDTPGGMPKPYIEELYNLCRKNQPGALVCSRIGHGWGDYATKGDMEVPLGNVDGMWETCDTTNDSWSYAWYDQNWKGPKEILRRLIATVARGGTYLLNIGPDGKGCVPELASRFLLEAGAWIRNYPQVVYAAGPSPWQHGLPWGDVTTQGDKTLLLSVFDWPNNGKLYLPGLQTPIASVALLVDGGSIPVAFTCQGAWTCLQLPPAPPDRLIAVIQVVLKGEVKVDPTFGIDPTLRTELAIEFADVSGAEKSTIRWMEKFGEWKCANQAAQWAAEGKAVWTVDVCESGAYEVKVVHKDQRGGRPVWRIATDEGRYVQDQQAATQKYQTWPIGVLEFATGGRHVVTATLVEGNREDTSLEFIHVQRVE
jgi:alpha-L-fucosidase